MDHRHDEAGGFAGVRVLLVGDDDPFVRRLADLFAAAGHLARPVFDARAAVAAVGRGAVDVVVCDLGATRLQSIATVLALRAFGDEAPPAVVVSSMPNVAQHCGALGVEHFLAQPFRFVRLLEVAERLGARYRASPSDRSGVFLRAQAEELLEALPAAEGVSFE